MARGFTEEERKKIEQLIIEKGKELFQQYGFQKTSITQITKAVGIARALLRESEILILDEPVNGLELAGIIDIRSLLQHLAYNENVTILMLSHLLDEVAKMATTVGIILHES